MRNIAEQITEGLDRFYKAFQKKRVLKSLEEISATTNEDDLASATAVAALNNNLKGFTPICDSTGKITGYKTAGGADTVFPFMGDFSIKLSGNLCLGGQYQKFTFTIKRTNGKLSVSPTTAGNVSVDGYNAYINGVHIE